VRGEPAAAYAREVANIDGRTGDLSRLAKDALYAGVGFGVLAFHKIQTRRRDLAAVIGQRAGEGRTVVRSVEQSLIALEAMVYERVHTVLPEPARAAVDEARAIAASVRAEVIERFKQAAAD
jgi:hypothetical protein